MTDRTLMPASRSRELPSLRIPANPGPVSACLSDLLVGQPTTTPKSSPASSPRPPSLLPDRGITGFIRFHELAFGGGGLDHTKGPSWRRAFCCPHTLVTMSLPRTRLVITRSLCWLPASSHHEPRFRIGSITNGKGATCFLPLRSYPLPFLPANETFHAAPGPLALFPLLTFEAVSASNLPPPSPGRLPWTRPGLFLRRQCAERADPSRRTRRGAEYLLRPPLPLLVVASQRTRAIGLPTPPCQIDVLASWPVQKPVLTDGRPMATPSRTCRLSGSFFGLSCHQQNAISVPFWMTLRRSASSRAPGA